MILVNYEIVLVDGRGGPGLLRLLVDSLQGRAAGTFVVLAGIGASLGARRARLGTDAERQAARRRLRLRGLFLFAMGLAFLGVWPADILHFYGAYLAIGSVLLFASARLVWSVILVVVGISVLHLLRVDYFERWDLRDYSYERLWTIGGFARNLFLNGWHPVFPWAALYLFGMLVGRYDLGDRATRRWLLMPTLLLLPVVWFQDLILGGVPFDPGVAILFSADSIPPTPSYLVAAASTAILTIVLCFSILERLAAPLRRALVSTGRMALTHYIAHVVIGLGILEGVGALEGRSLTYAVRAALLMFAGSVLFSVWWSKRFRRGPLEALMRRLT